MQHALLKVKGGSLSGKAFPLTRRTIKIGRGPGCDIRPPHDYEQVSREHARLAWDGAAFSFQDLDSANGSFIGDRRVKSGSLRNGDTFRLGDLTFQLSIPPGGPEFTDSAAPPPSRAPVPPPPAPTRPANLPLIGGAAIVVILIAVLGTSASLHGKPGTKSGPTSPLVPVGTTGAGTTGSSAPTESGELSPDVLAAAKASTVMIIAQDPTNPQQGSQGSGFCAFQGDWVFTNFHVVRAQVEVNGQLQDVEARLMIVINGGTPNEKVVQGKLAAIDPEHDLALIHLRGATLKPLDMGDASTLHETQNCFALGFPAVRTFDIRDDAPEVSVQRVEVESVRTDELGHIAKLQLGGTVTHGNSGGPIINADGQVVGVVREAARDEGMTQRDAQTAAGISYAIPANFVVDLKRKAESP